MQAVYDTQTKDCHIKDKNVNLDWVTNGRFDVVRLNNDLEEGTVISTCPFTTSSYTSPRGTQYQICPDTDYRGGSSQQINGITTQNACAQRCGGISGCTKAVWDSVNQVCHIKDTANDATQIWALNKQFDVIQVINSYNPVTQGSWTDFIRLPVTPVAAYVVPEYPESSRILIFSAWGKDTFGGGPGYTQFADYNFKTGAVSQRTVSNTQHDMFCPGISALEDGRIIITGGSNAEVSSIYDPASNSFSRAADMKIPRGYQTSATLSDGRVFTIGGSYSGPRGGKVGEVYDPKANTWTLLPNVDFTPMLTTDAEGNWRTDNHAWLFGWKNGIVFQAGPSPKQNWYGTSGSGSVVQAGTRPGADDQMCGVNVMYDVGKILTTGGSTDYTNSPATTMAHITTIGEPGKPSSIERVAEMSWPRGFANGVVLPDGTVLVTGGQKRSLVFTDTDGVITPELFNPSTKRWTKMASEAVPRNYHAGAILLPDGRVWSGGGGLCYTGGPGNSDAYCNKQVDHADGQIFSPPYLFTSSGSAAT
ncbi:Putative PAN/Apple domain, galactose oxidase/kelch, beta-propeller [Septoria linicola]|uniref:PAN/Apple domain, galactose oxidase/kelch, beta-propeller n=1 Tax=Septoria linicola TaxID=215465 RepID=A0A9Q9AKH3_9PEZI|nr:putative PAN/Apple domain, galactose oxidase/kelch, beta-propeller [Septoria linicola]USW49599.1 Putative PAN/Apple domain, galactose oxidase/kelch, beta-propeller [Septoria linicola]